MIIAISGQYPIINYINALAPFVCRKSQHASMTETQHVVYSQNKDVEYEW